MLDQFFSKIQTVQKDLYSNFNISANQKSNDELIRRSDTQSKIKTPSIELCNYYQLKWNESHELMERNMNLIMDSQKCLKELNELSTKQLQSQQNFNLILKNLNEIENGIEELDNDLNNVERNFEIVENLLKIYEKKKHQEHLRKLESNGQLDYQKECKLRLDDFESYKIKLLDNHYKKAKEIEKLQSVKFKKKSHLFQHNFEKEIEEYKRTGKLANRNCSSVDLNDGDQNMSMDSKDEKNKTLEEIDVEADDNDVKALNDFLDD